MKLHDLLEELSDPAWAHTFTFTRLQGHLYKQGRIRKNWKLRYFVILGGSLYYFKDKSLQDLRGSVALVGARVVKVHNLRARRSFNKEPLITAVDEDGALVRVKSADASQSRSVSTSSDQKSKAFVKAEHTSVSSVLPNTSPPRRPLPPIPDLSCRTSEKPIELASMQHKQSISRDSIDMSLSNVPDLSSEDVWNPFFFCVEVRVPEKRRLLLLAENSIEGRRWFDGLKAAIEAENELHAKGENEEKNILELWKSASIHDREFKANVSVNVREGWHSSSRLSRLRYHSHGNEAEVTPAADPFASSEDCANFLCAFEQPGFNPLRLIEGHILQAIDDVRIPLQNITDIDEAAEVWRPAIKCLCRNVVEDIVPIVGAPLSVCRRSEGALREFVRVVETVAMEKIGPLILGAIAARLQEEERAFQRACENARASILKVASTAKHDLDGDLEFFKSFTDTRTLSTLPDAVERAHFFSKDRLQRRNGRIHSYSAQYVRDACDLFEIRYSIAPAILPTLRHCEKLCTAASPREAVAVLRSVVDVITTEIDRALARQQATKTTSAVRDIFCAQEDTDARLSLSATVQRVDSEGRNDAHRWSLSAAIGRPISVQLFPLQLNSARPVALKENVEEGFETITTDDILSILLFVVTHLKWKDAWARVLWIDKFSLVHDEWKVAPEASELLFHTANLRVIAEYVLREYGKPKTVGNLCEEEEELGEL